MRDSRYDILFEPVKIGPKTLRNRFFQVPHCTGAGSDRPGFQARHRGVKAEGGWAAVCTEYCSIHPESDDSPIISARLWDDDDVRNLAVMCEEAHKYDTLAGVELWHGGAHPASMESRIVAHGVSQIPSDIRPAHYPRYSDRDDIKRLQGYYVKAAERAKAAGFDIIYVYAAHSEFPLQFLSPYYNRRTDEYGGSFENRARFWRETLEAVKEAVGDSCAIATRFSVDTLQGHKGIQVGDDGLRFIEHVDHLVDLWDLTIGNIGGAEWGQDAGPSRFLPENHEKPYTGRVKAGNHTDKPVVGVGRVTSPDTMVEIVRSGQFDLIGAARPSIADPFLPRKIEEGRLEDIRECIGCNQCIARWEVGGPPIVCTQNPTAGEEYRRGWHPEYVPKARNHEKTVLVIGGGPSGMECAMTLGRRGMEAVHLVDEQPELGGSLRWVTKLGHSDGNEDQRWHARGLSEWNRITDYRRTQMNKLENVEMIPNRRLTAEDVLAYGAEIVVVATGAAYVSDGMNAVTHEPIPGVDTDVDWQVTPEQLLRDEKPVGQRVLVFEGEDYFMGVSIAQHLAGLGHEVSLVTPNAVIAHQMDLTLEAPMMHRELRRLGVRISTGTMLTEASDRTVRLEDVWSSAHAVVEEVDTLVMCSARRSNDHLYRELRSDKDRLEAAGIGGLFVIGSAAAPRMIVDSVYDGHRLAREIDSEDPDVPLPYIRERRLWGASDNEDFEAILART